MLLANADYSGNGTVGSYDIFGSFSAGAIEETLEYAHKLKVADIPPQKDALAQTKAYIRKLRE